MNNPNIYADLDDWDDTEEDEVLYESEELSRQFTLEDEEPVDSIVADDLPVLPLRGAVVYPMMWLPLPIGQKRSIRLVEESLPGSRMIALVASKDENVEEPAPDQIHTIGTAAQIHRVLKTPDGKRGLNHVAFTVRDIHEVFGGGLAFSAKGHETQLGPGRHPISSAYFWYFRCPAGGLVEYYADEDQLTEAWKARDFEPGPTVFAEWAIDGGIDGRTRRQKGREASGKFLTEKHS